MLSVGVIGTGFGAKIHVPGFQSISGVRVAGISGKDYNKVCEAAAALKIPKAFRRWQDLVADPSIDIISVAAPPLPHRAVIEAVCRAGKPVLCEKPLAANLPDATAMLRAAKRAKIIHAIDFELRYLPIFQKLKSILKQNRIGKLRSFVLNFSTGGRAAPNALVNWGNFSSQGGGVLLNYGSHFIDYIEWLFGPIKSVNANLELTKRYPPSTAPYPTAEDTSMVLCGVKNGLPGLIFITNVTYGGQGQRLDVYGEKGTLTLHNPDVRDFARGFNLWEIIGDSAPKIISAGRELNEGKNFPDGRLAPFIALASDFIKSVKTGKLLAPSFIDGARVQMVMETIKKSSKEKKRKHIPKNYPA